MSDDVRYQRLWVCHFLLSYYVGYVVRLEISESKIAGLLCKFSNFQVGNSPGVTDRRREGAK